MWLQSNRSFMRLRSHASLIIRWLLLLFYLLEILTIKRLGKFFFLSFDYNTATRRWFSSIFFFFFHISWIVCARSFVQFHFVELQQSPANENRLLVMQKAYAFTFACLIYKIGGSCIWAKNMCFTCKRKSFSSV